MIFEIFLIYLQFVILVNPNFQHYDDNTKRSYQIMYPYDSINENIFKYYTHRISNQSGKVDAELKQKSFLRPQSFSILMNFLHDGQQSLILMDQQSIFW